MNTNETFQIALATATAEYIKSCLAAGANEAQIKRELMTPQAQMQIAGLVKDFMKA